jgi:hypothetical protein
VSGRVPFFYPFICNLYERRALAINSTHPTRPLRDDTVIYPPSNSPSLLCQHLSAIFFLDALADWCNTWKVSINARRSKEFLITKKRVSLLASLTFDSVKVPYSEAKYLGVIINNKLSWQSPVEYLVANIKVATKALYPLLCGKSKHSLRNKPFRRPLPT